MLNAPTSQEFDISAGIEGVKETLALMSRLVKEYKRNAYIITVSRLALMGVPARNWRMEAEQLCRFVQNAVRYTLDVDEVETIIAPDVLLRDIKAGDCDDMSLAVATLIESIGGKTRFVACGFAPQELSHVFVQARVGAGWISLDASEAFAPGWEPPDMKTCYVVHN